MDRLPASVTRRGFLLAGAGLVLGACAGGGEEDAASTTTTRLPQVDPDKALNLVLGTYELTTGTDQRVVFGVLQGTRPVAADAEVQIAIGPVAGDTGPFRVANRHADGIEARPLHIVRASFPAPGNYRAVAKVGDLTADAAFEVKDPATSKVPRPGQPMVPVATPTTKDGRGVDPICTRQPACPWHDVSLDDALKESKPVVLIVSTPALCQSAVCGPVLDILLGLRAQYEPKVRFVHGEVYMDNTGEEITPLMKAYGLQSEPYLFLAGADGVIRERIEGPFDRSEAAAALAALVS